MADVSRQAVLAARASLGVPDERIPRHVAVIMDGNGRWATERGLSRAEGHRAGGDVVRKVVTEGARLGLGAMTLYSFSIENWQRPDLEVEILMGLYAHYLVHERQMMLDHNVRLRHLGRRQGLPPAVLAELDESMRACADCTGMTLCLALNYGSRSEIVDAVRQLGRQVQQGTLDPELIDEQHISDSLDTAGLADPDLVIRTAGELRLSNFLLWQVSYAEFYPVQKYWPDFEEADLDEAIRAYARRERRFGRVANPPTGDAGPGRARPDQRG
jgi:undecaprenyl diphosphate synthase